MNTHAAQLARDRGRLLAWILLGSVALAAAAAGCDHTKAVRNQARANADERAVAAADTSGGDVAAAAIQPGGPGTPGLPRAGSVDDPVGALLDEVRESVAGILAGDADPDRALAAQVRDAIVGHPELAPVVHDLEVGAVNGVVTLRGWVRSAVDRIEIGDRARDLAGEENVRNEIIVREY